MAFPPFKPRQSLAARSDGPPSGRSTHHTARQALSTYWIFPSRDIGRRVKMPGNPEFRSCCVALFWSDFAQVVPLRGKVYSQGSRFPETATTSLGVLQLWPLPSSRLVSPRNQAAMITSPGSAPLAGLLQRVREQYREMPGLTLTKPQAQATRLFGVAPSVCAAMFRALVMENFLSRSGDGVFVRSTTQ